MLEKEFQYYLDNQTELVKKYDGKYIVIIGNQVIASYNSNEEAYFESLKQYQVGTFLIQHCTPGSDSYTQTFHSRVAFNVNSASL